MSDSNATLRALAYVDQHGDALDRVRAAAFAGSGPIGAVLEWFGKRQRDDGAIANEGVLGIEESLFALSVIDDLRGLDAPLVEGMCSFLASTQNDDGSWPGEVDDSSGGVDDSSGGVDDSFGEVDDSSGEVDDSTDARLYVAGMLAGHLAKTRWTRPQLLAAAGDFLAKYWSPDRVKNENWRGIAAHAHCFANIQHDASDEVLQWCGRELERGFLAKKWGAVQTARVLVHCDAHAIPGAQVTATELLKRIEAEQENDGGWLDLADPSPAARVARTLDAMAAIAHFTGSLGRC